MKLFARAAVAAALTLAAVVGSGSPAAVGAPTCEDTKARGSACQQRVSVGAAELDVTWHPGSDPGRTALESIAQGRPSSGAHTAGLHTRPTVKAIVVEAAEPFAIVRIDTLLISRTLYAAAVEQVQRMTGIPGERLLLAATHTHSASNGIPPDAEQQFLARRVAEAVLTARRNARPAALAVARTNLVLPGYNRAGGTLYAPEGSTEPKPRTDEARLDPQLSVLRFTDLRNGSPLAVLVNYAVHPVVLIDQQPLISGDFVPHLERRVQQAASSHGASPLTMWMTGAAGDINPIYYKGSYRHAEWTGAVIAEAAAEALGQSQPESLIRGRMVDKVIPLPEPDPPSAADVAGRPPGPTSARIQAVELSTEATTTGLVSWPGEPHARVGVNLRRALLAAGFDHALLLSLANDWGGYFRTSREHDDGVRSSPLMFYGRGTSSYVSRQLLDLAEHLRSGNPIDQIPLPPHAAAERAAVAAAARVLVDSDAESSAAPVVAPDAEPEITAQPASSARLGVVTVSWLGGSPGIARDWIPQVAVQRRHGNGFRTVAREGTGDVLLSVVRTPAGHEWSARWHTLPDTDRGKYRIVIEGRHRSGYADLPYSLVSSSFVVERCQCLQVGPLTTTPAAGGLELSVGVAYPPASKAEFRMLPGAVTPSERLVTTGQVLVDVVREGLVVDRLTLPFQSRRELVPDVETYNGSHAVPTETGRFSAIWSGDNDAEFRIASVDDGWGNQAP